MRVAIQGAEGSFHDLVAHSWFDGQLDAIVPCESFAEVFQSLEDGTATHGIVAVENSLYGSINEVYDLLVQYHYPIVGEWPEHIHQQLIGFAGTKFSDITRVYSHPVALNQCEEFLARELPHAERVEYHDTADSVRLIKAHDDHTAVAIASHAAAQLHEMSILREDIEDEATNFTRFLIIQPDATPIAHADKASLVLRTDHSPGALYRALGVFANVDANLTKIHSRPIRGEVWKYQFFIDVEIDADTLRGVTRQLERSGCRVILLGSYLRHTKTEMAE